MRSSLVLFLFLAILSGCSEQQSRPESEQAAPAYGGTYVIPLLHNPSSLDPALAQDEYGVTIIQQLFNGLVKFGPHLLVVPDLAETWQVEENGRAYLFSLRNDVLFHDNTPVTASDVAFSLKRLLRTKPAPVTLSHLLKIVGAEEYQKGVTDTVEGIEIVDAHTIRILLTEPHTPFLTALGMYQAKIVPEHVVSAMGPAFGSAPVGSGPFAFSSWQPNSRIVLEHSPGYFEGRPYLDRLHYEIYPGGDTDVVMEHFLAQKIHEMPGYGGLRTRLEEVPHKWLHRPSLSLLFYGLRTDRPPLDNPYLRKALSAALARHDLVREVYDGTFDTAHTILPPGMPGYTPPEAPLGGSLEEARQFMELARQSGVSEIPPLEIVSASRSELAQAEIAFISRAWEPLGITVVPKFIPDWTEFKDYINSPEAMIFRYVWFADMPDPDNFLSPLIASDGPANFTDYEDRSLDAMLQQAQTLTDPVKRAEMYQKIEKRVLQDMPLIPLFYLSVDRIYQPEVQNVHLNALGFQTTRYYRVWLEQDMQ
ncbi:MAG: ABC transporter substrate-binding protein [Desulfovibrionales bacterium]